MLDSMFLYSSTDVEDNVSSVNLVKKQQWTKLGIKKEKGA